MARLASLEWLRLFWWWVIAVPVGGIIFVIIGHGLMQVIGFMAIMWPFTIPARGVIGSSKSSRLFGGGVKLVVTPEALEFQGQTPGNNGRRLRMVMPRDKVRDVVTRGDILLVRTWHFGFAPVLRTAFSSPEDEAAFLSEVAE